MTIRFSKLRHNFFFQHRDKPGMRAGRGRCTEQEKDEDRSNPWRPWRVLNLNAGIAATRSLDPQLMERVFDNPGRRLPDDMPGFLADGKRQMMTQNVPEDVQEVMNRYAAKWPVGPVQ